MKDWTGNKATAFSQIGTIYTTKQTDPNRGVDYYASPLSRTFVEE